MISKSLSTSEKFAAVGEIAGPLAEFTQTLYPLLVIHTDDFGRLQGDPFTVKHVCFPSSSRSLEAFGLALGHLHSVHLITWYAVEGKRYVQIEQFEPHQQGLHKRTRSKYPDVSGNPPEIPSEEKRREPKRTEEKGTKGKYPPTPRSRAASRGRRLTRKELSEAEQIRNRVYGRCPHEPRCENAATCVEAIALSRRARAS